MFVGRKRLESAVFDATVMYNDGEMGRMDIFSNLGLAKGDNSVYESGFSCLRQKEGEVC